MAGAIMENRAEKSVSKVGILVVDNDEVSQTALRNLLDAEGWVVQVVSRTADALPELATGDYSLVIASVALMDFDGPLYVTLRELALAAPMEDGKVRARVLFLVPEGTPPETVRVLEQDRVPYVVKPFPFHDLLEKVSDLLMETAALAAPLRRVARDPRAAERLKREGRAGHEYAARAARRDTGMFAKRDAYMMTEEEIAEFEKSEQEEMARKRRKKQDPFA